MSKRASLAASTASQKKRAKRNSPSPELSQNVTDAPGEDLHNDPMIDPTDSEASEGDEDALDGGDDDETSGIKAHAQEVQSEAGPSRPKPKTSLYAPPTIEEMDRLRSAQEGGNTFTLQVEDLLKSTLLSQTPNPQLKTLLARIHQTILSLPFLPGVSPSKAAKRTKDIPFPGGSEWSPLNGDAKWALGWDTPAEVFVGGSWPVCGGYKKGKGTMGDIDLVVVMPADMFSPKDRQNYRYFHKRAHYLAVIKAALSASSEQEGELKGIELAWTLAADDSKRPIISFVAGKEQNLKHSVRVNIHASIPSGVFPIQTISPAKGLIRSIADAEDLTATPRYSTSILLDTLHKSHLVRLNQLAQQLPGRELDSFLALWRVWSIRRGVPNHRGGSGWFAGIVLDWIVNGGEIGGQGGVRDRIKMSRGLGRGLGYWGALRAAWEFLAHTDFDKTPVFCGSEDGVFSRSDFGAACDAVFIDPSRSINIFAEWETGDIQLLKHLAREALGALEDQGVDRFFELFSRNITATGCFDELLRIDTSSCHLDSTLIQRAEHSSPINLLAHSIATILRRGLSDRVKIVHVSPASSDHLNIGLIYDSTKATRVMDIGPPPEQVVACEAFRHLWGERSELRRFKDGSITESVVWEISRPEEATLIPGRIIDWLLRRHFHVETTDIEHFSANHDWLSITQIPSSANNAIAVQGSEKLGFSPIMKAYDELYRLLKSIDSELPLAILSVSPADEMLRYLSTYIPHPFDLDRAASAPECLKYLPAAEVIVQFESSPKWPDDLAAIQKVKLALMEKVARVITTQLKGAKAGVVFDSAKSEIADHAGLEVLLPGGVAFVLRIHHEKERVHLERIISDHAPLFGTSLPKPPRRLAVSSLEAYMHRFVDRPQHHASLAPLHHRYPSYSAGTRLLKRWFAAHMLSLLVPSEAVELVMASVYLDPGSLQVPSTASGGFLRAVRVLASWDWRKSPLFVPILAATRDAANQSGRVRFPVELRKQAETNFEHLRAKDAEYAHGAWVISTEADLDGMRWTKNFPNRVVAGRISGVAKATLETYRMMIVAGSLNVQSLFKTPLNHYDVLIHLQPTLLGRYAQALEPDNNEWEGKTRFRNLDEEGEIRVDFDPAWAFARDIQRLYGDAVLVCFDRYGGTVIGLLWNPVKQTSRGFKPFLGHSSHPVKSESALVEINSEAILGEILRLGSELVERVEKGKVA